MYKDGVRYLLVQWAERARILKHLMITCPGLGVHSRDLVVGTMAGEVAVVDRIDLGAVPVALYLLR